MLLFQTAHSASVATLETTVVRAGIYVGTYRKGATCFVFNGAVGERDKKLFDNARNAVGGEGGHRDTRLL